MLALRFELNDLDEPTSELVDQLLADGFVEKLWQRDFTAFGDDPAEIANRLGWLDIAERTGDVWPQLAQDAARIAADHDDVIVMGMGGSSLFPETLARIFDSAPLSPRLHVIDSTDPDAVRRLAAATDPARTFHIAASKSGSTVETRSHLAFFWERSQDPSHFGVITDPGSALGEDARAAGYAYVWENDPDIGGRYSALSLFGMVPAALLGVDGPAILDAALDMSEALDAGGVDDIMEGELNPGLWLGAALAVAARAGRDKLTFLIEDRLAPFGAWVEQLIAESTGKHGVGVVPIVAEDPTIAAAHPKDRFVVRIGDVAAPAIDAPQVVIPVEEVTDLGALVMLFEFATAVCGAGLGINPFDQPDVEAAKVAARALLATDNSTASVEVEVTSAVAVVSAIRPGEHVALCAFVDPGGSVAARLGALRAKLGRRAGVAVSLGIGPRFLHSTGQLHKGGPANQRIIQIAVAAAEDLAIPGQSFGFGELIAAQAAGDLQALHAAGKPASRVDVDDLAAFLSGGS